MTDQSPDHQIDSKKQAVTLWHFIRASLMPTLIGKTLVLYFGINHALDPDGGYWPGLMGSIAFTVAGLLWFLWKYKDYEDI